MSRRDSVWFLAGVLVAVAIVVGARAWHLEPPAARLAASGDSADDWKLLAESYQYMGRKTEADAPAGNARGN